jgi:hypothetical protein
LTGQSVDRLAVNRRDAVADGDSGVRRRAAVEDLIGPVVLLSIVGQHDADAAEGGTVERRSEAVQF